MTLKISLAMIVSISTAYAQKEAQPAGARRNIVIQGTSALARFAKPIAAEFARQHKIGVSVVGARGSKHNCVIKRTCDIGLIGAPKLKLTAEEESQLIHIPAAIDGVGVVIHNDLPVSNLSSAQLRSIFQGKIQNWKELGGPDLQIQVWNRSPNTSIRDLFDKQIGETSVEREANNSEEVLNRLKLTPGGISYVGLGTAVSEKIRAKVIKIDSIDPSPENVRKGLYKLARPLYFVRHKDSSSDTALTELLDTLMKARAKEFPGLGLTLP